METAQASLPPPEHLRPATPRSPSPAHGTSGVSRADANTGDLISVMQEHMSFLKEQNQAFIKRPEEKDKESQDMLRRLDEKDKRLDERD